VTGPDPSRPANNAPPRAVVLLSGGLDSAACLAIARSEGCEVFALSIDYGQRHRHELIAAANIARALGAAEHRVVSLDLRAIGGSALTSDTPVPKREHDAQHAVPGESAARPHAPPATDIPVTYVPARNLTFLSLCLGYAEVIGARELWIGVNAVDYSGYPDCRPAFIDAFERVANLATREGVLASEAAHGSTNSSSSTPAAPHFHVRTPLIDLTKAQIIRRGHELGVDFAMTHSCYDPVTTSNADALACGHCDSCIIRRRGFEGAGLPDPTRYADAKP
jgi:7-cyano-7-deazaguanine synthase